jgi:elongator complex protein 2
LANKGTRVNEEETGGMNENFDPVSVLTNTKLQESSLFKQIQSPPVEEILMARTLWPENQKLYGHAMEIFCVAASHNGDCAASSCKAKTEKYADIIIWQIV